MTARLVEVQASQRTKVKNCLIAANVGNGWQAHCSKMDQFAGKWKLLEECEPVRHDRSLREGVKTHLFRTKSQIVLKKRFLLLPPKKIVLDAESLFHHRTHNKRSLRHSCCGHGIRVFANFLDQLIV